MSNDKHPLMTALEDAVSLALRAVAHGTDRTQVDAGQSLAIALKAVDLELQRLMSDEAEKQARCPHCDGKGYSDAWTMDGDYNPAKCDDCNGTGKAEKLAQALRDLLAKVRRDAPELSGKLMGHCDAVLAAHEAEKQARCQSCGGTATRNVPEEATSFPGPYCSGCGPEAEKQATLTIEAPNGDKIVAHGSAVDMMTLERIVKAKVEKQAGPVAVVEPIGGEAPEVIRQKLRTLDVTMGGDGCGVLSEVIDQAISAITRMQSAAHPSESDKAGPVAGEVSLPAHDETAWLLETCGGSHALYWDGGLLIGESPRIGGVVQFVLKTTNDAGKAVRFVSRELAEAALKAFRSDYRVAIGGQGVWEAREHMWPAAAPPSESDKEDAEPDMASPDYQAGWNAAMDAMTKAMTRVETLDAIRAARAKKEQP